MLNKAEGGYSFAVSYDSQSSCVLSGYFRSKCKYDVLHFSVEICRESVFDILKFSLEVRLRPWQTRTHCCGHIVAHDVSWAAQTGKHLLRTQNVSEQHQKHFLCPGDKICVRNKCCARGKHLCRQQCVRYNVSSFARPLEDTTKEIESPCLFIAFIVFKASLSR